jgi:hypothetical protein
MANGPNIGFVRQDVEIRLPQWQQVDDCVHGEGAVKLRKERYLPIPETNTDPAKNAKSYAKYLARAVFYPVTGRTLSGLVGQVYSKPIQVDVPSSLEILVTDIDGAGTTLEQQSKRTLGNVLKKGRAGLLSDFPRIDSNTATTKADVDSGRIRPKIITYQPEQIINWREMGVGGETVLSLLVLHEMKITEDDGYEFETEPRWRVYELDDNGGVFVTVWKLAKKGDKRD